MPGLDERIERALRESARSSDADPGLVARGVERKKVRRQARRNAATGALVAAVLVTTAVVTVAIVRRDGGEDRRVATPSTTTAAQPADPVAAREQIAAVINEPVPPGPAAGLPGDLEAETITFLSPTEAIATVAGTSEVPGQEPTVYAGVRLSQREGQWELSLTSQCRIADPLSTATECALVPPDVRVSEGDTPLSPATYSAAPASLEPFQRADDEYLRAPVVSFDAASWVAKYAWDVDGATFDFPPSHLVELGGQQQIDLQGEILSFAEGEGAYWAVTHDKVVDTDGTEYRLKRIDENGVHTEPIPAGEQPVGRVVVGAGAAWVPVRDNVLRFDLETGSYIGRSDGPGSIQDRREIAISDGNVWITDSTSLLGIDTTSGTLGTASLTSGVATPLIDVVATDDGLWSLGADALVRIPRQLPTLEGIPIGCGGQPVPQGCVRVPLPAGFVPSSLAAVGDRVLVTGAADLAGTTDPRSQSVAVEPIALLVGSSGIEKSILISGGVDTAVALEPSGDLLLTSGGTLYRAQLP